MFWKDKKRKADDIEQVIPVQHQPSATSIVTSTSNNQVRPKENIETFGQSGLTMKAQISLHKPTAISGTIEGSLYSSSTVIVKKGALITASLDVEKLIVHGQIDSKEVKVRTETRIDPEGSIAGALKTGTLEINKGKLNGQCEIQKDNTA